MSTLKILIADDHEVVRRGLRDLLETERGWKVVGEAADGREALELATALRPGLVIVDLSMPEINGIELTRLLRAALPEVEVLVLTVHQSARLAREVKSAGARGYVTKADASRSLIAAVHAVSSHHDFVSQRLSEHPPTESDGTLFHPSSLDPPLSTLTRRELEVVRHLANGETNKQVAEGLSISIKTVEAHRSNIMRKLRFSRLADLVRWAVRAGLVNA